MSELPALRELTLTRIRVMLREPEVLFWVFAFPVLLALGLGVAFADPAPDPLRLGVERGTAAEPWAEALSRHPELTVTVLDPQEAADALRRGEVSLVLAGGDDAGTVVLRFDPTRPEGRTARVLADAVVQESAGATRPVPVETDELRQRGRRYIDWLIPGLIGFNLMSTGLWSVGFFVTQARQNRQLKRLVATPMPRRHFLLAQVLARFAFLIGEIPVVVLFAWLVFDVRIEGSLPALAAVVLVGAACFTGFGLMAASRTRTTEGVSGIINVIIMPMVVLSGVFFSPARFPDELQPLIRILPLTALNDALRAIYNDGAPLSETGTELALLAGWGVVTFLLALRWFRWQ
jgi:ABC-2 type transport system permease protein